MNSTLTNSTLFKNSYFYEHIALISTMSLQFLLGFSLNCYIIFLLLSRGRGVNASDVFTLNHSAAEIFFSIAALLYIVTLKASNILFYLLVNVLTWTSVFARLLFLCCVCLERYLAVVHPVTFLRLKPLRYRVASSVVVWIFSLLLLISTFTSEAYKIMISIYLMILAVEFFCCVSILRRLRDPGPSEMGSGQSEMNAAKKNAFQIISVNLLTCLAQNIPMVVLLILLHCQMDDKLGIMNATCSAVNIFAGFVQPFMILHKAGKVSFVKCS